MTETIFREDAPAITVSVNLRTGPQRHLQASQVGNIAIFEGDISLGSVDELRVDSSLRAAVVADVTRLWPGSVVPFAVHQDLPSPQRVFDAIAHWQERTPIRFVERTAENQLKYLDWVSFEDDGDCYSSVGRVGRKQVVSLGLSCSVGNAIHEIGHALGLWHEQSREDRGQYVRILYQNVKPGAERNFDQQVTDGDDIGDYDYGSIMHYGATFFSVTGQPTIEPIRPLPPGVTLGQRQALSEGDIAAIQTVYGT
jgi:hypothetical protein